MSGYAESVTTAQIGDTANEGEETKGRSSAMQALAGFLVALTNSDTDGRIVMESRKPAGPRGPASEGRLKFILLNASAHFSKVHIDVWAMDPNEP